MSKSPLYTRTGDTGDTSLVGGQRAPKDSTRLEAYGTIDEFNSFLGLAAATSVALPCSPTLWTDIQSRLFDIGSYLATDPGSDYASYTANPIAEADIEAIERAIDAVDGQLPPMKSFVIPGGTVGACHAHVARTVCRRAERRVIALSRQAEVDPAVIRYINRLSDLLFAIARFNNVNTNNTEIFWSKGC